jgi:hypothetical protein
MGNDINVTTNTLQSPATFISINQQNGCPETMVFIYSISVHGITS